MYFFVIIHSMCKQMGYTNIMHDKRVIRGSNFAKKSFVSVTYYLFIFFLFLDISPIYTYNMILFYMIKYILILYY